MKKLVILGAGGYGQVAKDVARAMGCFDRIEFLDDHSELAVGHINEIESITYDAAFVAIGDPKVRSKLCQTTKGLTTLIHPRAVVMPSARIGCGSIVEAGAVICSNAVVGSGCIVMANAVVGHDAVVGDYCQLKYGCAVSERARVPEHTKIDCNTSF